MATPISQAIASRTSIRSFIKEKPVSNDLIRSLLQASKFSPSGGNLQPWHVLVVNGDTRNKFVDFVSQRMPTGPEYNIYPSELADPYLKRRTQCAEDMYSTMGVQRTDRAAKLAHVQRNFTFFDAPCAVFFTVKKYMGAPQWADIGMFMQSFMLLAQEQGLSTCAQEAWANHSEAVKEFFSLPDDEIVFCAIAVGYSDAQAPINKLRTRRAELDEFCTFATSKL